MRLLPGYWGATIWYRYPRIGHNPFTKHYGLNPVSVSRLILNAQT